MRLLLDTHAFLWAASDPSLLGRRARAVMLDTANERVLSVASIWELSIKIGLGKLTLATSLAELVAQQVGELKLALLAVDPEHALGVQTLPLHHRDPFDRMLVCQCRIEGLELVSADRALDAYGVRRIW